MDPRPLRAWLEVAAATGDRVLAAEAAARAVRGDGWDVVTRAGPLSRASLAVADADLGLDHRLEVRPISTPSLIAQVPAGAPYPVWDAVDRKRRGAWDTPPELVRRVVDLALAATTRRLSRGVDPACGTGGFLVALAERGVEQVAGVELDAAAAAVARVAVPRARVVVADGLTLDFEADLVVGNPPFVAPEHQDKASRAATRAAVPGLVGRFDLAVPFATRGVERLRPGGGLGMVLPASIFCEPYAQALRSAWLREEAITGLVGPLDFPGARGRVMLLGLRRGGPPVPLPSGALPTELLSLQGAPLDPIILPGDAELVRRIHGRSLPLGALCEVDTGVVSHGPRGGKAALLEAAPGPGLVPYVDAADLGRGAVRGLRYEPAQMHRAKRPGLFSAPKLLVQRIRGGGPLRVWLDEAGLFAGHTLLVVLPRPGAPPLARLQALLQSPLVQGLLRLDWGARLDLYPRDLAALPVPVTWLEAPSAPLEVAWELKPDEVRRLEAVAAG